MEAPKTKTIHDEDQNKWIRVLYSDSIAEIELGWLSWTEAEIVATAHLIPRERIDVCMTHLINKRNTAVGGAGLKIGPDFYIFIITIYKSRAFQPRTTSQGTIWAGTISILENSPLPLIPSWSHWTLIFTITACITALVTFHPRCPA